MDKIKKDKLKKKIIIAAVSIVLAAALVVSIVFPVRACKNKPSNDSNTVSSGDDDTPVAVTSVTLDETELTLTVGNEHTLTATVAPENATNKTVTWSVEPSGIVTVENGKVTAVAEGSATITATADGKSDYCLVTVNNSVQGGDDTPVAVTSVKLDKTKLTLDVGDEHTLTATVAPENATDKTVVWSVEPAGIVTVENGKVTAVAQGTATITATADGKSDYCLVTVNSSSQEDENSVAGKTFVFYSIVCDALTDAQLEFYGESFKNMTISFDNEGNITIKTTMGFDENAPEYIQTGTYTQEDDIITYTITSITNDGEPAPFDPNTASGSYRYNGRFLIIPDLPIDGIHSADIYFR